MAMSRVPQPIRFQRLKDGRLIAIIPKELEEVADEVKTKRSKYSEKEIEAVCRMLYETPGGGTWAVMSKLSPSLRSITRRNAIRVLDWHYDKIAEDLL